VNRPVHYSVSPDRTRWIGPAPDAAYTINGQYIRSAQVLVDGSDEPICPEDHHDVIVWHAMVHMCDFDEARLKIATSTVRLRQTMGALKRDQLPEITLPGPLA
jgi:hypothetical protein